MKGDFSRVTFNPRKHYSSVRMQQGRVQLDADWNEQVDIMQHYLRCLAADIIGPHGGPGFHIKKQKANNTITDLKIGTGHYYVDGILCENGIVTNDKGNVINVTYYNQPCYPINMEKNRLPQPCFLVYLDVWERHITCIEDADIREVALGGPDTTTRTAVVWQVKVLSINRKLVEELKRRDREFRLDHISINKNWDYLVEKHIHPKHGGILSARAKKSAELSDRESASSGAFYRGSENHLYRVEVHTGGSAGTATFKWSRDNGSVVYPIRNIHINSRRHITKVTLDHMGHDSNLSLQKGDWVEIKDDTQVLQNRATPLLQIFLIDNDKMEITLNGTSIVSSDQGKHPLLRRWDHESDDPITNSQIIPNHDGALYIKESTWLKLEDGIQILFRKADNVYRTGDYWLIPARTATGNIEWPTDNGQPLALPPQGIVHHYAPLAIIGRKKDVDCRNRTQLTENI
jgi:hypothetical protein